MQTPSGQMTAPALQAQLKDGALAGDWVLDPRTSSIRPKSRVLGLVPTNGVFREVSGNGTISPDGQVSGTVAVAVASIDTNNTRRDTHLRSSDFFDSGNNPDITFTADDVRPSGQGAAVTGELTVPIAIKAEVAHLVAARLGQRAAAAVRRRRRPATAGSPGSGPEYRQASPG
jgi:polyisoprenoid-binding protein YceI